MIPFIKMKGKPLGVIPQKLTACVQEGYQFSKGSIFGSK